MLSRSLTFAIGGVAIFAAGALLAQFRPAASAKADKVEKAEKPVGGVGVVDLDAVAKRLGRDIEMQNQVQERLASLNAKLASLQDSLRRLHEEKREKYGDEMTDEQIKELQLSQDRMDAQLREFNRKAQSELAVFRQALVDQFREQAKPVLRQVAAARGLSIVVPKNDGLLLTVDPAAEITDDVAAKMPAVAPEDDESPAAPKRKKAEHDTSLR